jgi:hypothetical protein
MSRCFRGREASTARKWGLEPEDIEKNPNTFRGINNGWPAVISSLKSLLKTGEPIAFSVSLATGV